MSADDAPRAEDLARQSIREARDVPIAGLPDVPFDELRRLHEAPAHDQRDKESP